MKERILTGWTFTRVLFVVIGIVTITQSVLSHQWFGVAFGSYFASMGLFAFGCAAGNCAVAPVQKSEVITQKLKK
jgi:hypothetical protein